MKACAFACMFVVVGRLAAEPIEWQTGPAFNRLLTSPTALGWSETPLRQGLENLSRSHQIAVFLDRRVDPDQRLDFNAQDIPLGVLLEALAQRLDLGVCYVGPVVYMGPASVTRKLATVTAVRGDEQRGQPVGVSRGLVRLRPWQWDELSPPRELVEQLADEVGLRVEGLEQIPHDLWPAVELPPLSFAGRMSIVLAGFDLTFAFNTDGSAIRIQPMPADNFPVQRSYTVDAAGRPAVQRIAMRYPDAKVAGTTSGLTVTGSFALHDEIDRTINRPTIPTRPVVNRQSVYELNVENNPAGGVLRSLAQQFKLELKIDPRAAAKLDELVSFRVKDASEDDLLKATLEPVGLEFRRNGNVLEVVPREN